MLFYSYFKTLVGKEVSGALALGIGPPRAGGSSGWKTAVLPKQRMRPMLPMLLLALKLLHLRAADEVTVELKNDLAITGVLHSVDQYLNIKLTSTRVVDEAKYPHMMSVRNCFVRGSVVRYVHLPPGSVDVEILHDATRREAKGA
ncbi:putative U6 snRNA-associated Sm-like protein LSm2 [Monoraphidium neglectum]|uniref:Putative U6 snRNA-associated Sm-like protein LSm2 n=1 Tax=Monoraphidium neglectum TaxID=145388 RepID=A0A0D2MD64_9CHLO|nr:putative U6 snRNA-associated Sm-like protein LSm2 [Monoraphidium neglectum]KIY98701.1 putative U6 snRNA-associated Sm-like protein LSm2 [Monoraphidium neglectum]|eukprot:XP_013897721.1 putative U6 snRNA-associated Sm-like protein LSm2 [Monoraphidium neglectum]